ncbi:MAG: hypothetical protein J6C67_08155 [Muribaculaceae bacterium]|nr:hypothetical protein [Muribaculaceae bacterium]
MKSNAKMLICALMSGGSAMAATPTLEALADGLMAVPCYADSCSYEVYLPSMSDPVHYDIFLESTAAPTDTLSPADYEINWRLTTASTPSAGFSAYFNGNHFRFRDTRLQEYHIEADASSFAPAGDVTRGVQRQAQFAELLPQYIGLRFRSMAADSAYSVRIADGVRADGRQCVRIEGVERRAGYDASEFTYLLDAATLMPVAIELENNPGQLGEQSISVHYSLVTPTNGCRIDMETLLERHSEAFERYRTDAYTLETLPGKILPRIAGPTLGGARYVHDEGEPFGMPAVIVFADSRVGTTPELIHAVEQAALLMPVVAKVVFVFVDKRAEDVEPLFAGTMLDQPVVMLNGGAAVRDCGIGAVTPVIIFASPSGKVTDYIRGFNQDLGKFVIEKTVEAYNL